MAYLTDMIDISKIRLKSEGYNNQFFGSALLDKTYM